MEGNWNWIGIGFGKGMEMSYYSLYLRMNLVYCMSFRDESSVVCEGLAFVRFNSTLKLKALGL
jgi:hypothetical protein